MFDNTNKMAQKVMLVFLCCIVVLLTNPVPVSAQGNEGDFYSKILQNVLSQSSMDKNTQDSLTAAFKLISPMLQSAITPENIAAVLTGINNINSNLGNIQNNVQNSFFTGICDTLKTYNMTDIDNLTLDDIVVILTNTTQLLASSNTTKEENILLQTVLRFVNQSVGTNATHFKPCANRAQTQIIPTQSPLLAGVSNKCRADLGHVGSELMKQQLWAMQMLDAWGKPGDGIFDGNIKWLGSFDMCRKLEIPKELGFGSKYCSSTVKLPLISDILSKFQQSISLGYCFPDTCSTMDIYLTWKSVNKSINIEAGWPRCQSEPEVDTKAIILMTVIGFIVILVIFATVFEAITIYHEKQRKCSSTNGKVPMNGHTNLGMVLDVKSDNHVNGNGVAHESLKGEITNNYKIHTERVASVPHLAHKPKRPLCVKLLLSFSLITNISKLMNTDQAGGSLGCVNGIRFMSMSWVILGHTLIFLMFGGVGMKNITSIFQIYLKRGTFAVILNGLLSVDSFFLLSGLLVSYLFMKEMKKNKGRINWFMFYFHRFWRLSPPYMLVLFTNAILSKYWANGPLWSAEYGVANLGCMDTWWWNLLYVNNFMKDLAKMCFGWSWYLANDMQFYVISPLILVPLYFNKKIGCAIAAVFFMGVSIATIVVSVHYSLPTTLYSLDPSLAASQGDYFNEYYIKPYCRMGPYIVGLVTGYILYLKGSTVKINKFVNIFGWITAIIFACMVVYGIHDEVKGNAMSLSVAALYNAFSRSIWGICVAWVIFSCVNGYGGYIDTFLSWRAFIPLGRLTYCAYLVHPIVLNTFYLSRRDSIYITDMEIMKLFCGFLLLSYGAAFVVSMLFEAPMMGLEKAIFRRGK